MPRRYTIPKCPVKLHVARRPGATGHWAEPNDWVWAGWYDLLSRDRDPDPGKSLWADGMEVAVREIIGRMPPGTQTTVMRVRSASPTLRFRMRYIPATWGWVADPIHEGGSQ